VSRVSINFCHLAGGAAFDVLCNKGFHVWPPEVRRDKLEGFGDSSITCSHMIVEKGNYPPPKFVVCHNNQGSPVMPVGAVLQGEVVDWGPSLESFLFGVLCMFDFLVNIVVDAVHVKDFDRHVVLAEIFVRPH